MRIGILEEDPDPPGQVTGRQRACGFPRNLNRPAHPVDVNGVRDQTIQAEGKGALARATRSRYQHSFTGCDRQ